MDLKMNVHLKLSIRKTVSLGMFFWKTIFIMKL